jgi:hypothetical protein
MKPIAPTVQTVAAGEKMAAAYRKQFQGVPEVLDKMADVILAYRPKDKTKKPRKRKKAKRA